MNSLTLQLRGPSTESRLLVGAVSLQLRALTSAGLLDTRAERKFRYYRARREALGAMAGARADVGRRVVAAKLAAELEQTRRGPHALARAKSRAMRRPRKKRKR
jgi:DNA-binding transcriptional ArsR family regulator